MLLCNLRPLIRWQVLFGMLSILTLPDATLATTTTPPNTQSITNTKVSVSSLSALITQPTSQPQTDHQTQTTNRVLNTITSSTGTTKLETTSLGETLKTSATTDKDFESSPSSTSGPNLTTAVSNDTNVTFNHSEYHSVMNHTTSEPTTDTFIQSSTNKVPDFTSKTIHLEVSTPLATKEMITECQSLRRLDSDVEVVCFQYPKDTSCETAKVRLKSLLCDIINNTADPVTFYSSEVNPKCILWIPTTKAAGEALKKHENLNLDQEFIQIKWEHLSEHVTTWRKITIALVTCGVLLAAFILACYFLSNRESWSPGRQRLGEDPYYTETDSQGNTLVSVSAHGQDKLNSGTRENGTGQTTVPASTNGHSNKKQNVSDTEL